MLGESIRKLIEKIKIRKDIGEIIKRQNLICDIKKLTNSFTNQELNRMSIKQLKVERKKRIKIMKNGGYVGE